MIEIKNVNIKIDTTTVFYKNCKRRRKEEAKICSSCPFKNIIEQNENKTKIKSPTIYCRKVKKIKDSSQKRVFRAAHYVLCGSSRVDFDDAEAKENFIFAYINGKPVGVIEYYSDKSTGHLSMVYTLTKYRKCGIMRAMIKRLLKDYKNLIWSSTPSAKPAYLKIGARVKCGSIMTISRGRLK